jgi:hypothetical protein
MPNSQGRVHVKNKLNSVSHIIVSDLNGGLDPAQNKVTSVKGVQADPTSPDTFEWTGDVKQQNSNKKHLLIKLTCTKGRTLHLTESADDVPTAGTVTITLTGGNPPPPNPVPVTYVDDGT